MFRWDPKIAKITSFESIILKLFLPLILWRPMRGNDRMPTAYFANKTTLFSDKRKENSQNSLAYFTRGAEDIQT